MEQRPEYEGMRWRDPYSFQARLADAMIEANGYKNYKEGTKRRTDNRMLEGVLETYDWHTTRQEDGEFTAWIKKTDANLNVTAMDIPQSVLEVIKSQVKALQAENKSRKARESARQRLGA